VREEYQDDISSIYQVSHNQAEATEDVESINVQSVGGRGDPALTTCHAISSSGQCAAENQERLPIDLKQTRRVFHYQYIWAN
jgi:hypothetical protein